MVRLFKNKTSEEVLIQCANHIQVIEGYGEFDISTTFLKHELASCDQLVELLGQGTDKYQLNDGNEDLSVSRAIDLLRCNFPSSISLNELKTTDNLLRVSIEPPQGLRETYITPDWGDKTTWYEKSVRHTGVELTNSGDNLNFYIDPNGYSYTIVDNFHGKYSNEDWLTTEEGYIPRSKVYVDGYNKSEQDPHYGYGGDYTIDYLNGIVTFLEEQTGTITMDFYQVGSSTWTLTPPTGKILKITRAEVQFAINIDIRDTIDFQPYGYVQVFAPQYWQGMGGPYPTNTKIPLGNPTRYKTMMDFINEANGAMPIIPKNNDGYGWRNLTSDIIVYPWDYSNQAIIELRSSYGMEIRIQLQHNESFNGSATAAFYCVLDYE